VDGASQISPPTLRVRKSRRAITLLEVLLALAIFLFSLAAIVRLISIGGDRALDIQGREAQLCQAKLAEVTCGALGVQPGSTQEGDFEEAPGWHWTVECQNNDIPGLWNVKVTVSRQHSDGSKTQAVLTQMVLDPGQRGSTLDPDPVAAAASSSSSNNSSNNSSNQGSSPNQGSQGGGGGKPPAATGRPNMGGNSPPAATGNKPPVTGPSSAPSSTPRVTAPSKKGG
jgi:hypothetical protein